MPSWTTFGEKKIICKTHFEVGVKNITKKVAFGASKKTITHVRGLQMLSNSRMLLYYRGASINLKMSKLVNSPFKQMYNRKCTIFSCLNLKLYVDFISFIKWQPLKGVTSKRSLCSSESLWTLLAAVFYMLRRPWHCMVWITARLQ